MAMLPDDIWVRILELGIASARLTSRDLCALAIASRRLDRISRDPALWSTLLALDFPQSAGGGEEVPRDSASAEAPPKSLYRIRFERDKARRLAAARRAVLFAESKVAISRKRLGELASSLSREGKRLKAAAAELAELERVRSASVALNVWQPEVVRGGHKRIVEQCTVPIESRLSSLNMEVKVCKHQIDIFSKAYNKEKKKLNKHKEALSSLKYHPLHSDSVSSISDSNKQKKLKQSSDSNYANGSVKHEKRYCS